MHVATRQAFALAVAALLAATAGPVGAAQAAPAFQDEEAEALITSPGARETVSGIVVIVGTASAPDFRLYRLEFIGDPAPTDAGWEPVQAPVEQRVREGVLGGWDTTTLPDGFYRLRLVVVTGLEEEELEYEVRVEVSNATATPLPLQPTITPSPSPGTPTPGPSPTPLIQQPPTRTPRPTETPGGPATLAPPPTLPPESPLQPNRLRQAAWRGVQIALGVFAGMALYGLARAAARGQLRERWWDFRREVLNPLLGGRNRRRKE